MNTISALIEEIQKLEKIYRSKADWDLKYNLIFGANKKIIRPLLDDLGLDLEYYDPDTSYEEDVSAYMTALQDMKVRLEKLDE